MRINNLRRWGLASAVIGVAVIAVVVASRPSYVTASPTEFSALQEVLRTGGVLIEQATADNVKAQAPTLVAADQAVAEAVREYGKVDEPIVSLALVSADGMEPRVDHKPMYVVQLGGLNLPPMGGGPYPSTGATAETTIHHELVVFVDAVTGAYVFTVTAR